MAEFRDPKGRLGHRGLLEDEAIATWYEARKLKSKLSAEVHLRQLGLFCYQARLSPGDLVNLGKERPDELRRLLVLYANHHKSHGRLASYTAKIMSGLGNWLAFNHVDFDDFPGVRVEQGASLVREKTPTPEQLRLLLGALSPRGRVIALAMAHAGLRPGVLGSVDGTDGLMLGDVPELKARPARFELDEGRPFLIRVPGRLSKNALGYATFGTPELAEALLVSLADRARGGEKLSAVSPVVGMTALGARGLDKKRVGGFLTTKSIVKEIHDAIVTVKPEDVTWRPYVLRAYCSTQLLVGRMDSDAREAVLGHDLGVSGRYNLRKRLADHVIESLRESYERAMGSLLTAPRSDSKRQESVVEAVLLGLGFSEEDARRALRGEIPPEKVQEMARGIRMQEAAVRGEFAGAEAKARILAGWEIVARFGEDSFILEGPADRDQPPP